MNFFRVLQKNEKRLFLLAALVFVGSLMTLPKDMTIYVGAALVLAITAYRLVRIALNNSKR